MLGHLQAQWWPAVSPYTYRTDSPRVNNKWISLMLQSAASLASICQNLLPWYIDEAWRRQYLFKYHELLTGHYSHVMEGQHIHYWISNGINSILNALNVQLVWILHHDDDAGGGDDNDNDDDDDNDDDHHHHHHHRHHHHHHCYRHPHHHHHHHHAKDIKRNFHKSINILCYIWINHIMAGSNILYQTLVYCWPLGDHKTHLRREKT